MTQIALHLDQASIPNDMEFYLTDRWDKHNQIRPRDDIVNLTLDSENLEFAADRISNFLYPMPRHAFEAIYIGPSLELYANQWGCAFLSQLLRLLVPEGKIILRVYPEGRGHERGCWCRTSLETSFLNRTGLGRARNIRAENDGVMSMRVGRSWPRHFPSTIDWFFRERGNLLLNRVLDGSLDVDQAGVSFVETAQAFWKVSAQSAVIERIIDDQFGARVDGKRFVHLDAPNSLLTAEVALNGRFKLASATAVLPDQGLQRQCSMLVQDFTCDTSAPIELQVGADADPGAGQCDVVVLIADDDGAAVQDSVARAWELTASGGILVWQDDWSQEAPARLLAGIGNATRYYAVDAAVKLRGVVERRAYAVVVKP